MKHPLAIVLTAAVALNGLGCTTRIQFKIAGEGTFDADPQNDAPEVVAMVPYNNGDDDPEPEPE